MIAQVYESIQEKANKIIGCFESDDWSLAELQDTDTGMYALVKKNGRMVLGLKFMADYYLEDNVRKEY